MAEGTFPDLAAREVHDADVSAVPMASTAVAEDDLIVANDDQARAEVIEPGRALAIADFPVMSSNPGEWLIRVAYRMGVPGSMLSMPIGKKVGPRLLATVTTPLAGDRAAGIALRAGHFLVHGAKTPIAQADFSGSARMTPPLERAVHSFDWLTDIDASAPREEAAPEGYAGVGQAEDGDDQVARPRVQHMLQPLHRADAAAGEVGGDAGVLRRAEVGEFVHVDELG